MLKIVLLIEMFLLLAFISPAQSADEVLSKFFAVQLEETVFIRWTISQGNSCNDTYVERSADGISYERIGQIGGICGSPDQAITYEFTDTLPLVNRVAYYRLQLGAYGYTSAKIVEFIRYNEDGLLLAPNPFSEYTRLAFENTLKKEYQLIVSEMQGKIVAEMVTTGKEFILHRNNMSSGLYYFYILQSGKIEFKGKLVIR